MMALGEERSRAGESGVDRRNMLKTIATGVGMASLLGGESVSLLMNMNHPLGTGRAIVSTLGFGTKLASMHG